MFELRSDLSDRKKLMIEAGGMGIILLSWLAITELKLVPSGILPSPLKVLGSFAEMHFKDELVRNAGYSYGLNVMGLLEALVLAIPIGFALGLFSEVRAIFERYVTAARFLPLTALVGVFIAWFGIDTNMKVQFLALSIFIYLLPQVIQKVDSIEDVYVQTVTTLGANKWQTFRWVFMKLTLARVYDDVRVLAALSWTYIVVAEMVNSNGGGIGALAYVSGRASRIDKVFGILLVIVLIGFIQDKLLVWLDRRFFPFKYATKSHKGR